MIYVNKQNGERVHAVRLPEEQMIRDEIEKGNLEIIFKNGTVDLHVRAGDVFVQVEKENRKKGKERVFLVRKEMFDSIYEKEERGK